MCRLLGFTLAWGGLGAGWLLISACTQSTTIASLGDPSALGSGGTGAVAWEAGPIDPSFDAQTRPLDAGEAGLVESLDGGTCQGMPSPLTVCRDTCGVSCNPCLMNCGLDCRDAIDCTATCDGPNCVVDCSGAAHCAVACQTNPNASTCGVDCRGSQDCQVACAANVQCAIDCREGTNCNTTCAAGADCTINCRGGGDCSHLSCEPGATCELRCDLGQDCKFLQCADEQTCADGSVVCNKACL